jgi:hypothetical protein
MEKQKLTIEQEAQMLVYILYHKGRIMKGETRAMMYEIYRYFKQDRDASICSCLDRDTSRKVDGFIDSYSWSDEVRFSPRFAEAFPHLAQIKEELKEEFVEESTQPIDMDEVLGNMFRTTIRPEDAEKLVAKSVPVKPIKRVRKSK